MADKNIKRVGLYFNLEENEDRLMYEYLCTKKKSKFLKRLIEDNMKNDNYNTNNPIIKENDEKLDDSDIDTNFMSF